MQGATAGPSSENLLPMFSVRAAFPHLLCGKTSSRLHKLLSREFGVWGVNLHGDAASRGQVHPIQQGVKLNLSSSFLFLLGALRAMTVACGAAFVSTCWACRPPLSL